MYRGILDNYDSLKDISPVLPKMQDIILQGCGSDCSKQPHDIASI